MEDQSKALEVHIRAQRLFLAAVSGEEKKRYFKALLPTEEEFNVLFGEAEDAWRAWRDAPDIAKLVTLYGKGGRSARITVRALKRDSSWYHGRVAGLVRGQVVFRVDVQAELNLKPNGQGSYVFVNERWVLLCPPSKTLEVLERSRNK